MFLGKTQDSGCVGSLSNRQYLRTKISKHIYWFLYPVPFQEFLFNFRCHPSDLGISVNPHHADADPDATGSLIDINDLDCDGDNDSTLSQ
jgi:hypothetical protein